MDARLALLVDVYVIFGAIISPTEYFRGFL